MLEVRVLNSAAEMKELAAEAAGKLKPGMVLLLSGELGSGKTTFTQGLAEALGIKERVNSPTFTVVSNYEGPEGDDIAKLVHVDLYRLADGKAAGEAVIKEVLDEAAGLAGVTVIEWADKLGDMNIDGAIRMKFEHGKDINQRKVSIL